MKLAHFASLVCLLAALGAAGCATVAPTKFINPDYDFSYLQRVAVLPLEDLSQERDAGVRASRLLITELLATGAVNVVEPGEVSAALMKAGVVNSQPTTEQVIAIGKQLGVQAVITGAVTQAENQRRGAALVPVVTIDLHMVETETGQAVWAATHTETGSNAATRLLGSGGRAISETMRRCVRELVETLVR